MHRYTDAQTQINISGTHKSNALTQFKCALTTTHAQKHIQINTHKDHLLQGNTQTQTLTPQKHVDTKQTQRQHLPYNQFSFFHSQKHVSYMHTTYVQTNIFNRCNLKTKNLGLLVTSYTCRLHAHTHE